MARLGDAGRLWLRDTPSMRRPLVTALALAAAIALPGGAAVQAAGHAKSQARPTSRTTTVEGIDISHWQGTIDWSRVGSKTGDLLPALDLEDAGGLSTADLTTWVRTWVERVRDRVG